MISMPTEQQKFSAAVDTYATTRMAATLIRKARKMEGLPNFRDGTGRDGTIPENART